MVMMGNGPMKPSEALSINDLKKAARRKLPRIMFDFIEGGCDDEVAITYNMDRFRDVKIVPRYMRDMSVRDSKVEIFGQSFDQPFGISPTGMAGMMAKDADLHLAGAAAAANAPYLLSGASNASIEKIAKVHPGAWYQIYLPRNETIRADLIKRAELAGMPTLVVTVDIPAHSKRERNIRQGWQRPYKPTWATKFEALRHPAWVWRFLREGLPYLENWQVYAPSGASSMETTALYSSEVPAPQSWDTIRQVRDLWPGNLVLKGILHPDDAREAVAVGVDGIIVSNHGGRQFDRAPASIEMLPLVRDAVGGKAVLMLDSGITRGSDIVAAFCLGASMTFVGRSTLYGVAAFGRAGADRAFDILAREVDLALAQSGAGAMRNLDASYLFQNMRA